MDLLLTYLSENEWTQSLFMFLERTALPDYLQQFNCN